MRRREGGREGRGALEEEKHQFYKRVLPPARCPPVPLPQCPWLARHASLGGKRERKGLLVFVGWEEAGSVVVDVLYPAEGSKERF